MGREQTMPLPEQPCSLSLGLQCLTSQAGWLGQSSFPLLSQLLLPTLLSSLKGSGAFQC